MGWRVCTREEDCGADQGIRDILVTMLSLNFKKECLCLSAHHQAQNGSYRGACSACHHLQSHSADLAELRRMSVKAGLRRSGVAKKLGQ
eukprot:scaffold172230_cov17-Tisochrysis_lutea.AAC.1